MGLAATQARFLGITARKANLEFRSMEIAQNKLSVTQDLAEATDKYQNALNATMFTWVNGEAVGALSYSNLMRPSALNDVTPFLITDKKGAVVLDSKFASAALAANILPAANGANRTQGNFELFIDALKSKGVISSEDYNAIVELDSSGNNLLDRYTDNAGYGETPLSKDPIVLAKLNGIDLSETLLNLGINLTSGPIYVDGKSVQGSYANKLSLENLLSQDVVWVYNTAANTDSAIKSDVNNKSINGDPIYKLLAAIGNAITQGENNVKVENNLLKVNATNSNSDISAALTSAIQNTIKLYTGTNATSVSGGYTGYQSGSSGNNPIYEQFAPLVENYAGYTVSAPSFYSKEMTEMLAVTGAMQYNSYVLQKGAYGSSVAIDLSNLVKSFMTYYDNALYDNQSGYSVSKTKNGSNYVTDNPGYQFAGTNSNSTDALITLDFYMQMFNNICTNGWVENTSINDDKTLENMLRNGSYFITTLSEDGYFYQHRYNDIQYLVEVKDENAIAQAEMEYEAMKTKLTYKEDKLDIDMKNLDAELSALTTEYQTVQGLISKNIEKSFDTFKSSG